MSVDDSFDGGDVDDDALSRLQSEEWEDEIREVLEETDHDTELGLALARDARRLIDGEITEAEFRAKYDDDVIENLETSLDADGEHVPEIVEDLSDVGDTFMDALKGPEASRREVMKKMSAGAAFLGLGAWAAVDDGPDPEAAVATTQDGPDRDTQWGMVIDLEGCDGCLSCVVACSQENDFRAGANWMYVLDFEDSTPGGSRNRLVRPCQHCTDAPCEQVCPTTARHTRPEDGLVLTEYDVCIGCRYCQVGCPYGVNYFAWDDPDTPDEELDPDHVYDERGHRVDMRPPKGVMGKCTMCPSRQDGGHGEEARGTTACEQACPPEIIKFGDMNDPDSDPNQYLEELEEEDQGDAGYGDGRRNTFKLLEEMGTSPNITYVGHEPGPNAEQIEGPVSYDDIGEVDNRKDALDEQTVGGDLFRP